MAGTRSPAWADAEPNRTWSAPKMASFFVQTDRRSLGFGSKEVAGKFMRLLTSAQSANVQPAVDTNHFAVQRHRTVRAVATVVDFFRGFARLAEMQGLLNQVVRRFHLLRMLLQSIGGLDSLFFGDLLAFPEVFQRAVVPDWKRDEQASLQLHELMSKDVSHAAELRSMEVPAVTSGIFASFRSMATGTSKPQISAPALAFLRQTSSHAPFESVARLVPEKSTNFPSSTTSRDCKSSVRRAAQ